MQLKKKTIYMEISNLWALKDLHENYGIVLQARSSSKRFPRKIYKK